MPEPIKPLRRIKSSPACWWWNFRLRYLPLLVAGATGFAVLGLWVANLPEGGDVPVVEFALHPPLADVVDTNVIADSPVTLPGENRNGTDKFGGHD